MQVEEILQQVLTKHHQNQQKRQIVDGPQSWTVACPICGDSKKNSSKKRGHLYKKNLFYVCYNCNVRVPFNELLKLTQVDLDPESMYQINEQISAYKANVKENVEEMKFFSLQHKISLNALTNYLNSNPEHKLRNFKPVKHGSAVWYYLVKDRKISNLEHFYEAEYEITHNVWQPIMVSLNRQNDLLLGFQWRNLENRKDRRRFKVYSWQECWEFLNPKLSDESEYRPYNKVSYLYNIMNIDPEVPITIFEGFIDSQFVPNSISLVGVNTDYSFLLTNEDIKVRFFFDNDNDGKKATKEMLNKGFSVFLWDKFFKDFAAQSSNPEQNYYKLKSNIKDLNQLAKKINNPYQAFDLEQYFAKDRFDMLNL